MVHWKSFFDKFFVILNSLRRECIGITSSGYRQDMGLQSVIDFPFVVNLTTAPCTWPALPVITSVTLPNFHRLRGQCSSWTTATSPTISDRGTPVYNIRENYCSDRMANQK